MGVWRTIRLVIMGYRKCDETGELMQEGWVLADSIYIKYLKDLDNYLIEWSRQDGLTHLDVSDLRDYYFDNGMYFWTTWYNDED